MKLDSVLIDPARLALLILTTLMLLACNQAPPTADPPPESSAETPPMTQSPANPPATDSIEQQAIVDLSERLGIAATSIRILSQRAVTWSDGALGCPAPDTFYTQALVPGHQLILAVGDAEYYYHASSHGRSFLCPDDRRRAPLDDRAGSHTR